VNVDNTYFWRAKQNSFMIIECRAYARAGLLGNPSDGYFGKTISVIVKNFGAIVSLYQTPELVIEEMEVDRNSFRNIYHLTDSIRRNGYYGGRRLIKAIIKRFGEYCEAHQIRLANKNFTIRYESSIPRQVGLAGSSAIATATMRALMQFYDVQIPIEQIPSIVLAAETEELSINAGLQDRVIQAYEGCVFMDFDKKYMDTHHHGKYQQIDPTLLPKLYLAYKTDLSKVSGAVFNNLKERFNNGDELVHHTIRELGEVAVEGRQAIINRDYKTLNQLIDHNFDLRCKIMNISDSNMEFVQTARASGASAKFSGSGGAIIGMYPDDDTLSRLVVNLKKINARVIKPYII
jgi:glucuronokinase